MSEARIKRYATLVERQGFEEISGVEPNARIQILFHMFPAYSPVPMFLHLRNRITNNLMTVVFDPTTGKVWFKDEVLNLARRPFCFLNKQSELQLAMQHRYKQQGRLPPKT